MTASVVLITVAAVLAMLWWRSGHRFNSPEFYRLTTILACLAIVAARAVLT
jgi:hypothetical protein